MEMGHKIGHSDFGAFLGRGPALDT